eukprot:TRINITY_DN34651_c0_g1_i1.p1 TRINITY_DN34651_c0_g1~~TRINITY_DN34651_c0_g1_i1.p1  ORF type:complete len:490 (-),score=70.11 TRINITY_DN34651_c0_g1_i1:180-1649(-)
MKRWAVPRFGGESAGGENLAASPEGPPTPKFILPPPCRFEASGPLPEDAGTRMPERDRNPKTDEQPETRPAFGGGCVAAGVIASRRPLGIANRTPSVSPRASLETLAGHGDSSASSSRAPAPRRQPAAAFRDEGGLSARRAMDNVDGEHMGNAHDALFDAASSLKALAAQLHPAKAPGLQQSLTFGREAPGAIRACAAGNSLRPQPAAIPATARCHIGPDGDGAYCADLLVGRANRPTPDLLQEPLPQSTAAAVAGQLRRNSQGSVVKRLEPGIQAVDWQRKLGAAPAGRCHSECSWIPRGNSFTSEGVSTAVGDAATSSASSTASLLSSLTKSPRGGYQRLLDIAEEVELEGSPTTFKQTRWQEDALEPRRWPEAIPERCYHSAERAPDRDRQPRASARFVTETPPYSPPQRFDYDFSASLSSGFVGATGSPSDGRRRGALAPRTKFSASPSRSREAAEEASWIRREAAERRCLQRLVEDAEDSAWFC